MPVANQTWIVFWIIYHDDEGGTGPIPIYWSRSGERCFDSQRFYVKVVYAVFFLRYNALVRKQE